MSTLLHSRRGALALGGASLASLIAGGRAFAQALELTVFGHRVHQACATAGPGGDATEAFRKQANAAINWTTLGDNNAIAERLLRELSLSSTSFDVAYLLNGRAVPKNLRLLEPLDAFQKEAPIESIEDFAPGLMAPLKLDGALHGIPVRHATNVILYNEAIFEEKGVKLPTSFEEVIDAARKLTFKRDDGTQVYGLAFTPVFASNFLTFSRALGGDYMTIDRKIVAAEAPMVNTLKTFADLFKAGAIPRNVATLSNEEVTTMMQQGRAAMTINPTARLVSYNNPQQSKYPGKLRAFVPPMAKELQGKTAYAPTVEFWALTIPANSRNKRKAWDLVAALSSKAGTTAMALNGNGPTRISTYQDAKFRQMIPYADIEAAAVGAARIHLPAFDEQARAHDIFVEESQAAMLGMKPADQAMADAVKRVQPLVGA
ncbi:ABC transporter substrate-binding protein [Terrarubrum flagellatum]|uniref:ABC transporter substrate-binding protein n=1 Tax=Terrirubrum flagellatum TaxID=2895980 RepID=UPI0031454432